MPYQNLLQVFLISVLPISLIKFKVIHTKFRLIVLSSIVLLLGGFLYVEKIPLERIGVRTDNISSAILPYILITITAVFLLLALSRSVKNKVAHKWYKDPHFLFLFIPISFAQQFLFQGFILYTLQASLSVPTAVIVTALIFGYLHTIYPRPFFSMVLGTVAGLLFASMYIIHPNIIISSVAHSILNFTAVYLGFFTFTDTEGRPKKTELHLK